MGSSSNVCWSFPDSLAACPAGDNVTLPGHVGHPHPSRLTIDVWYSTAGCVAPKAGVPPESILVTTTTVTGNLQVNDKGSVVFADDSTDAGGHTTITIPSFSGCGTMDVSLTVAGVFQGTQRVIARSTDTNADGRTTSGEPLCDFNYDGQIDSADNAILLAHADHWHRNALHGTLVRRTNLYYGEHQAGSYGGSQVFWNPSGRWLSYTIHAPSGASCNVWIVPSEPAIGNQPKQFSWPTDSSDYDPSWSPLNTEIAFGRADYRIVLKGIPGLNPDTTERTVAVSGGPDAGGDLTPAVSPNGQWVAFARLNGSTGDYHIWKCPITGGAATQLTFTSNCADQYPNWSPDGAWIAFDREVGFPNEHNLYKIKANQVVQADTTTFAIYKAPMGTDAALPGYSPDGLIMTGAFGTHSVSALDVRTHTLDPALQTPKPILNYPDTTFAVHGLHPVLSPRVSPDGTRLALASRQVWAARRNMNHPPAFTSLKFDGVTQAVEDTAATRSFFFACPNPPTHTITVSASDPEGDALTYLADFVPSNMTWVQGTRTLTFTSSGACQLGQTYYVKFRVVTESGGTDALIAVISFPPVGGPGGPGPSAAREEGHVAPEGVLVVAAPYAAGATAQLSIFDLSGRRVARVHGPSGSTLVWDGKDERTGWEAATGIYFYRMEAGNYRREGKVAVVR